MSNFLANTFIQYALICGLLSSVACGIVGTYAVSKKITFIAGSIAHTVLAGMGIVYYFNYVYFLNVNPLVGAFITAVIASFIIGIIHIKKLYDMDTIISVIWALGMGIGIVFIAITPGYSQDLNNYLFGNILMVSESDLYIITIVDILIITLSIYFYNKFLAICFDEEFLKTRKINVTFYYIFLLILISLTIVTLIQMLGLILVIALISIPPSIARRFTIKMHNVMILSVILGVFFTISGILISYYINIPSGASIVIIASLFFIISLFTRNS